MKNDPKLTFSYNLDKDIWCIANKGKSSNNSPHPTKIYQEILGRYGINPGNENINDFIEHYLRENKISPESYINKYQDEWTAVSAEYHTRAESVFGIVLPIAITVYLTINNRCPYNIGDNLFFVSFPRESVRKTIMHELWHFYTWYGLGQEQEKLLGNELYNELKESLTVLLNLVCTDLLPQGVKDEGYPQHQELRTKAIELWDSTGDINKVWTELTHYRQNK